MWSKEIDCRKDKVMPAWLTGGEQLQVVVRDRLRKRVINGPACKVDWSKARGFKVWLDMSRRPRGANWWWWRGYWYDGDPLNDDATYVEWL